MEQEEGEVLMGKVEYMSPEQAQYLPTDRRSDLFSLGIVMYELLTGHHIFETDDIYQTLDNVKEAPIPNPKTVRPELPDMLCDILMKALERDLTKRYQTAGEMGVDLEYYMYHKGYGPTNVTLGNYLKNVFLNQMSEAHDTKRNFRHRADTLIGDGSETCPVVCDKPRRFGHVFEIDLMDSIRRCEDCPARDSWRGRERRAPIAAGRG